MIGLRGGSDTETGDIVLIADAAAFKRLAAALRASEPAMVDIEPIVDRPAITPIESLHLKQSEGMATIYLSSDVATLSGDPESFARLADEVELFLAYNDLGEPGMHTHIDASSTSTGSELLAAGSRGLTLAGPIPDDRQ
jgi:hypothetical protein